MRLALFSCVDGSIRILKILSESFDEVGTIRISRWDLDLLGEVTGMGG